MKNRRINWRNVSIAALVLATLILVVLTPSINRFENLNRIARGLNPGFGGECFLWIFTAMPAYCLYYDEA